MRLEILLRLGELTLKSRRSRRGFIRRLISNIRDALLSNGYRDFEIENLWSRILVKVENGEDVGEIFKKIFGIVGFVYVVSKEFSRLEDIVSYGESLYSEFVKDKTFAVKARREGIHDFTSIDVNRELGRRLLKYSRGVDLKNPEVWVKLEVRDNRVYYYLKEFNAYGGLPVGSSGQVISLLSGGFDSAVASWYALKRGLKVHYFHAQLAGSEHLKKVLRVAKYLADNWSYGYRPKIYIADFRSIAEEIRDKVRDDYRIVVLKRFIYRGGEYIANITDSDSLITGESLGQVSSQTLKNLRVSQAAVSIPINRPLFGFDKEEIIRVARDIGTYELSKEVSEVCSLTEGRPILNASLRIVEEEEAKVSYRLLDEALKNLVEYDLRSLDLDSIKVGDEELQIDIVDIPPNAVLIDIRNEENFSKYHIPGSINISKNNIFTEINRFKGKPIVLICDMGFEASYIAKKLRDMGFEAYYLKGGVEEYRKSGEDKAFL